MRCKETTGFLMLRRCDNAAMFQCVHCGKDLCGEHATVVYDAPSQKPPPTEAASSDALPVPPMVGQTVACRACLRQPPPQRTGAVYDDYYYSYPYYGSYHPYYYGHGFSDRDRRVFDRRSQPVSDVTESDMGESDALGS